MVVEEPGKMVLREFDLPAIGPEDGLLKVEMAGVCGSDPGMFRGKATALPITYPLILCLALALIFDITTAEC